MSLLYQPLQYTVYKQHDYSWNKNYKHNIHAIVFYYSMIDIPEILCYIRHLNTNIQIKKKNFCQIPPQSDENNMLHKNIDEILV